MLANSCCVARVLTYVLAPSCCVGTGSVILWNLSVSVLQWLTLTQSSRGWQEGQQMILLSISGGRSTQHSACSCCNWLTHSPPSRSPHAVFVIGQAAAATFDTQNAVVPPTGVAIGLLIAISLSFDRTWSQTISNDLITIKSWWRQALRVCVCWFTSECICVVQCIHNSFWDRSFSVATCLSWCVECIAVISLTGHELQTFQEIMHV